jgi:hypothetical protein
MATRRHFAQSPPRVRIVNRLNDELAKGTHFFQCKKYVSRKSLAATTFRLRYANWADKVLRDTALQNRERIILGRIAAKSDTRAL